ncbi:hypothetical protein SAICODRAFT_28304 [Saitoella complicata NRRL Y-17804]|nr:uncharacterized protein SAICODRAFT_28304 [Saitoella complicata NRRL Y-17804]ODQ55968.1 hypothetical protein SAICODRAFT_28304 [Saitoella complicata NRRL Y-17804]
MSKNGEMGKNYTNILCLLLRLRQACNHPDLVQKSLKNDKEALSLSSQGSKPIVEDKAADELADLFGGISVGGTEALKRCEVCFIELSREETKSGCVRCKECDADVHARILSAPLSNEPSYAELVMSTKIRRMMRILRDEEEGEDEDDEIVAGPVRKTIIFSQFTTMLDLVEPFLKAEKIGFSRYDGSMPNHLREQSLDRLRTNPSTQVLLCSLKCGALGLNLTAASRVILLDVWWNPAIEEQSIDRVHRIGQTRNVIVHKLTIRNTVEERIVMLQDKKREMSRSALGDGPKGAKVNANKLSMTDILYLFKRESEVLDDN